MHSSLVIRHAASMGRQAFFDPLTATSPFSLADPATTNLSIHFTPDFRFSNLLFPDYHSLMSLQIAYGTYFC